MYFEILSEIEGAQTIARGLGIRELPRLKKFYGLGNWRKRKGFADVRLGGGEVLRAELRWYEASGIGKRDFKIKRYLG